MKKIGSYGELVRFLLCHDEVSDMVARKPDNCFLTSHRYHFIIDDRLCKGFRKRLVEVLKHP